MKKDYLVRLSRAARWYLPPAEAAEVIADYRELLEQRPRSPEQLDRELGRPSQAVRLLTQPRSRRIWTAVFGLLTVCLLLPAAGCLCNLSWWFLHGRNPAVSAIYEVLYDLWELYAGTGPWLSNGLLVLGWGLSLAWFQKNGSREPGTRLPKGLLPVLAALLAGLAGTWLVIWLFLAEPPEAIALLANNRLLLRLIREGPVWGGLLCALAGLAGLINARLRDRRWRAACILGLTVSALCAAVMALATGITLDRAVLWQAAYLRRYLLITLTGMAAAGAGLC